MLLNKIKKLFLKNKKEILFFSFFIVLIFSIGDSFATDAAKTAASNKEAMDSIIKGLNFFVKIFSSLLGIFSSLISLFLNPGWVNGTIFNLDIYMKDIWILVSNVVYFAFAFILIIIAIMNIFGKGGGSWELKSALPKFVIGVIMVPFTWFFVQFILSISAILTISVLGLPYDVMADRPIFKQIEKQPICTDYTFDLTVKTSDKKNTNDTTKQLEECTKGPQKTKDNPDGTWMKLGDLLSGNTVSKSSNSSVFGMINVYTYGIMKIQDIDKVTKNQLANLKSIFDIGLKLLFDLIFMIMFLLLMIALFLALFSRGIWLWLYTMLSPVFGLLFFFGKSKEGVNKISPVKFIELAMVPVYVAAALSFGMIFLFTATQGLTDSKGGKQILQEKGNGISELHLGDFTIKIKGTQGGDTNDKSIFNSLGSGIGQMIIEIFGLSILWIAVMAALNSSDITKSAVEPIASFGEKMGKLVMNAPKYAPIIPTPEGRVSAMGLDTGIGTIKSEIESHARNDGNKLSSMFFGDNGKLSKNIENLGSKIDNLGISDINTANTLRETIKGHTASELARNSKFIEQIKKYNSEFKNKKDKDEFIKLITSGNGNDFARGILMLDKTMDNNQRGIYSPLQKNTMNLGLNEKGNEKWFNSINGASKNDTGTNNSSGTQNATNDASKQVAKQVQIGNINYNISKNGETIKFDNKANGGADFEINKSDILENGKISEAKIKDVLKKANIEKGVDRIVEEIKKQFKENSST